MATQKQVYKALGDDLGKAAIGVDKALGKVGIALQTALANQSAFGSDSMTKGVLKELNGFAIDGTQLARRLDKAADFYIKQSRKKTK
jgi:lipid-binding SYLF domain-containing protein